jgi:hypothetical protein
MNIDEFASQHLGKKIAARCCRRKKSPKKKMWSHPADVKGREINLDLDLEPEDLLLVAGADVSARLLGFLPRATTLHFPTLCNRVLY